MVKKEAAEWITKADKDLDEASFLFKHNRPLDDVAFFVHQATEKYLKAYLISQGWELEKIHDLVKLTREAIKFDKSFEEFIPAMEKITDFYIESRYPVDYEVEYTTEEIEEAIKDAEMLQVTVKKKV